MLQMQLYSVFAENYPESRNSMVESCPPDFLRVCGKATVALKPVSELGRANYKLRTIRFYAQLFSEE
jgi:hypothetical protein